MTENEKLDLILAKLDKVDKLERDFSEFREELDEFMAEIREELDELKRRIDKVENDVLGIKITLENEIRTNIMRVAEGHQDLYRKLREATKTDDEREMIAIRVNMMEAELRTIKERLDQIA